MRNAVRGSAQRALTLTLTLTAMAAPCACARSSPHTPTSTHTPPAHTPTPRFVPPSAPRQAGGSARHPPPATHGGCGCAGRPRLSRIQLRQPPGCQQQQASPSLQEQHTSNWGRGCGCTAVRGQPTRSHAATLLLPRAPAPTLGSLCAVRDAGGCCAGCHAAAAGPGRG